MLKLKVFGTIANSALPFRKVQWQTVQCTRFVGVYRRPKLTTIKFDYLAAFRDRVQKEQEPLKPAKWKALRDELLSSSRNLTEYNVDATLISLCNPQTQLRVAQSYLDFLKSEGEIANYATIGRILRMFQPAYQNGQLTEADEKFILETYRRMRSEHEILDETTCENLISALVVTSEWKHSFELLEMIKILSEPSVGVYSAIITKAFESFDDWELGWKLLREVCDHGRKPKCEIFIQYLKTASLDASRFHENLAEILQFIGDYRLVVSRKVIGEIMKVGNAFQVKSEIATLSKAGQCSICKKYQPENLVTTKEFMQLSSSFMDKVLVRKDVFQKSRPEEVERYIRFIEQTAPYDCVIDGLNVAFSTGKKPPIVHAKILVAVVRYFKEKGKNILVLGRKHMNKWPVEQMRNIRQNANLFLTEDISHDDPFLLYATLKSGPNASFVSRDLMRSHAHLLGPELKQIFRRWQQAHQYQMVTATDQGKVIMKSPIKYSLNASKIDKTWHLPFRDEYSAAPSETFDAPQSWLCLSFDNVKKSQ